MVHSLKFVIYPIQILFNSFKVVPVRLSLVVLGRNISIQSVELLLIGTLLVIGNSENVFLGNQVYGFFPNQVYGFFRSRWVSMPFTIFVRAKSETLRILKLMT
jgi:hypothetical protein